MNVLYDRDHYKLALGQLNICRNLIDNIGKEYVRLMKFSDSLFRCKQLKRAALGRMCTLMKKQSASLAYLEQVRQHLARLPSIDPNERTLLITGFPNVGKVNREQDITKTKISRFLKLKDLFFPPDFFVFCFFRARFWTKWLEPTSTFSRTRSRQSRCWLVIPITNICAGKWSIRPAFSIMRWKSVTRSKCRPLRHSHIFEQPFSTSSIFPRLIVCCFSLSLSLYIYVSPTIYTHRQFFPAKQNNIYSFVDILLKHRCRCSIAFDRCLPANRWLSCWTRSMCVDPKSCHRSDKTRWRRSSAITALCWFQCRITLKKASLRLKRFVACVRFFVDNLLDFKTTISLRRRHAISCWSNVWRESWRVRERMMCWHECT